MSFNEPRKWLGLGLPAWGAIIVGAALLWGLLYFLIHLGPRPVETPEMSAAMNADQWKLVHQIDAVEQRYRRWPVGAPLPEGWEDELAQAISRQEQLLRRSEQADPTQALRLDRLQILRDTLRARLIWPKVEEAEVALKAGLTPEKRVAVLEELLRLRRQINHSQAAARYKNLVRETLLERELEAGQAEPLRAMATAEVAQARTAADRQDWPAALEHYTRAREVLDDLNLRFSRTRYADLGLQSQVKAEETALQGAPEAAEIEVYEQGGDAAAAVDQVDEAAEHYRHAMELQTALNRRWPRSRFVSTTRLNQLEAKLQTALSVTVVTAMHEEDQAIETLLARRQTLGAAAGIAAMQALAEKLTLEYPKSRRSDDGLSRKYAYLATLSGSLRTLQDDVYDRLVPLPGAEQLMLLRTEVPQELYARIMKFNPSRREGPAGPVDSVTWSDASEFCRRLGWVLGRTVRLPTETEFNSALHDTLAVVGANDGGSTAGESGLNGYQNLRDGVGEWLAASSDVTSASIAPGTEDYPGKSPERDAFPQQPKDTRDRNLGFRVLVESPTR